MTCCNTSSRISRTCRSIAMRANTCPFPNGASLNSGFPTPFVRSSLRICDRKLSAKTMNVFVSSPSKKKILSFSVKTFHGGANCFPNCRTSNDLDWRTVILVLPWQSGTINFVGDTIILVSVHQVLTFSFRLEYESGGVGHVWVCLRLLDFSRKLLIQFVTPVCGIAHTETAVGRHFVHVRLRGLRKCQVYVVNKRPQSMKSHAPSGCGTITVSKRRLTVLSRSTAEP